MLSVVVTVTPPAAAERVALTSLATDLVVTLNVADELPAATVIELGTVAEALLLDSLQLTPPLGAGPPKLTVPVLVSPPATLAGDTVSEAIVTGSSVNGMPILLAPKVAVMVSFVVAVTPLV
jgi:hypothetical protein